jgi:hypothetical protein
MSKTLDIDREIPGDSHGSSVGLRTRLPDGAAEPGQNQRAPGEARTVTVHTELDAHGDLVVRGYELGHLAPGSEVTVAVAHIPPTNSRQRVVRLTIWTALAIVGWIMMLASFGKQWPWTGFRGVTLWAWMSALVGPLAVAVLTIRLLTGDRMQRFWHRGALAATAVFASLVICGYWRSWAWTGWTDKQLWDWLTLLLFPIALLLLPDWIHSCRSLKVRHYVVAAMGAAAFTILVFGGYNWQWNWTGFTGNTFQQWLTLLIVPFLLPAACCMIRTHELEARTKDP